MSKRRELDPAEHALWAEVVRGVEPAQGKRPAQPRAAASAKAEVAKPSSSSARTKTARPAPEPRRVPAPKKAGEPMAGVDGATAERLRRGRIDPDAVLDLHGLTQERAYASLSTFVRRHHARGDRCLLVITGKGSTRLADHAVKGFVMPERSRAGVLRSLVPHWLNESDMRPLVVGVQSAHRRHGGSGALYVYLRRRRKR
jgi:DNA-nicking Smr family endonuclease